MTIMTMGRGLGDGDGIWGGETWTPLEPDVRLNWVVSYTNHQ